MADEPGVYESAEQFFFKTPLYQPLSISADGLMTLFYNSLRLDGYCPYCRKERTFRRIAGDMTNHWFQHYDPQKTVQFGEIQIGCAHEDLHRLRFHYRLSRSAIQKIGQWLSFADIAIDESKSYSKLLTKEDAAEFHKALGLAAHGVGIGSFVYIRRIFERLIQKRFDEFREQEGWDEKEYQSLRMFERIAFLKNHLPEFLVRNARVYSILSVGIHELTEDKCLAIFDILKSSTIIILEEDRKIKEERDRQKNLERAIAAFEAPTKSDKEAK